MIAQLIQFFNSLLYKWSLPHRRALALKRLSGLK